jgi:hypothetical protein
MTMFVPGSVAVSAARDQAQSALPHAPVVPDKPVARSHARSRAVRGSAARLLLAAAVRIDSSVRANVAVGVQPGLGSCADTR